MKKTITVLVVASLFSFQLFAQVLNSGDCSTPDSTCQAFELDVDVWVLKDFSVNVISQANLGKVRRGEEIQVNSTTEGHRGKTVGQILVVSDSEATYQISCIAASSIISFPGGVTEALSECNMRDIFGNSGVNLADQQLDPVMTDQVGYLIDFGLTVPAETQDGDASGSIHIELAYE